MAPTRILLVDDQSIILDGLSSLLAGEKDLKVVGVARSGEEALAQVELLRPNVVVMDISMPPGMDGIEATGLIKQRWPACKVLVLSMYHQNDMVNEVLDAGANGYVLKNTDRREFAEALRTISRGHRYLAAQVAVAREETPANNGQHHGALLTRREKEIVKLIARGCSTQEVSGALSLSYSTVETHRKNIMHKLGLKNGAGLVRYALERGWNE